MARLLLPVLALVLLLASAAAGQEGLPRELVRQREDLRALQEKMGQVSNDARAAQEDVASMKGEVARLKSENESLRKEIARLEGLLQKLDAAREQDRRAIVEEVSKELATMRKAATVEAPRPPPSSKPQKPVMEEGYEHVVKKGEFLSAIADAYGVTVAQLKEANALKSNDLKVGQRLFVPKKAAPAEPAKKKSRG